MGSGCGSVGRAVASNIRGPHFESSQRRIVKEPSFCCQPYWKYENKEKEAGYDPFLKTSKSTANDGAMVVGVSAPMMRIGGLKSC